jgi:hypothetical protein
VRGEGWGGRGCELVHNPLSRQYFQYFASISWPGAAKNNGWTLLHSISPVSRQYLASISPVSHQYFASISSVFSQCRSPLAPNPALPALPPVPPQVSFASLNHGTALTLPSLQKKNACLQQTQSRVPRQFCDFECRRSPVSSPASPRHPRDMSFRHVPGISQAPALGAQVQQPAAAAAAPVEAMELEDRQATLTKLCELLGLGPDAAALLADASRPGGAPRPVGSRAATAAGGAAAQPAEQGEEAAAEEEDEAGVNRRSLAPRAYHRYQSVICIASLQFYSTLIILFNV